MTVARTIKITIANAELYDRISVNEYNHGHFEMAAFYARMARDEYNHLGDLWGFKV